MDAPIKDIEHMETLFLHPSSNFDIHYGVHRAGEGIIDEVEMDDELIEWETYLPVRTKYPNIVVEHWRDDHMVLRPTEDEVGRMYVLAKNAHERLRDMGF